MSGTAFDAMAASELKVRSTAYPKRFEVWAVGAGAAPLTSVTGKNETNISILRTGVGTFTGTFPPAPAQSAANLSIGVNVDMTIVSASVAGYLITAINITAGTFAFTLQNGAGTATDLASGETIQISLDIDTQVQK
jgi:hypothetical protein